jgi:hypothetical protein
MNTVSFTFTCRDVCIAFANKYFLENDISTYGKFFKIIDDNQLIVDCDILNWSAAERRTFYNCAHWFNEGAGCFI